MSPGLTLRFPDRGRCVVGLGRRTASPISFESPISRQDHLDLRWYLEVYPAAYSTEVDDAEARRIEARLPKWGEALFDASFRNDAARQLLNRFLAPSADGARPLTIEAEDPRILALPWELLRQSGEAYLFDASRPISIRRRVAGIAAASNGTTFWPKQRLRVLLVCCRPTNAAFLNPRTEATALLEAAERHSDGRIDVEFLRPATFRHLVDRLNDELRPAVDVVHFDGHGVFDAEGAIGDRAPDTGYLLFERDSGLAQPVSPLLWRTRIGARVPLVILSACQSAAMPAEGPDDASSAPIGSVACGLAASGSAGAVLAMTHSLLAESARTLFAEFYRCLAQGAAIGTAVDAARRAMLQQEAKHDVQRGPLEIALSLQDWFLPALYQAAPDGPLLRARRETMQPAADVGVPPSTSDGFIGRQRELWDIERWFVGGVRRISIVGFGGQGKTQLALEVGRWLHRTGLFARVVTVRCSEPGAGVALAGLRHTPGHAPTLIILDALDGMTPQQRTALLDAGVEATSQDADRLIVVSRDPHLRHAAFPDAGDAQHRQLVLAGLAPHDAFDYLRGLLQSESAETRSLPDRDVLADLLEAVDFHPLSIRLLARHLLRGGTVDREGCLRSLFSIPLAPELLATLGPSFDAIPTAWWAKLCRFGVMRRGGMEHGMMSVTQSTLEHIQMIAGDFGILDRISVSDVAWKQMLERLEAVGLLAFESIDGVHVRYVRLHPALPPLLRSRLPAADRDALEINHRLWYHHQSAQLYNGDFRHPDPIRAVVQLELPNLLRAVHGALDAGEAWSPQFGRNVLHFVEHFGMSREAEALATRMQRPAAVAAAETPATLPWHAPGPARQAAEARRRDLTARGNALLRNGDATAAADLFGMLLAELDAAPSLDRCLAMASLATTHLDRDQPERALTVFMDALAIADAMLQNRSRLFPQQIAAIDRQRALLLSHVGLAFQALGRNNEARTVFEQSEARMRQLGDDGAAATVMTQRGYLALGCGELDEAERLYTEAADVFWRIGELASEAMSRHQLGMVLQGAGRWDAAEVAYREAARIRESTQELERAADSWNLIGQTSAMSGRPDAAEAWFRKALATRRQGGDAARSALTLHDLAILLQGRPDRLDEARVMAEESLAIRQRLGAPASHELCRICSILAQIADAQGREAEAQQYRRKARAAWHALPDSRQMRESHSPIVEAMIAMATQPQHRGEAEAALAAIEQQGKTDLAAVVRRILDGERDGEALMAQLGVVDADIVDAVLYGINRMTGRQ